MVQLFVFMHMSLWMCLMLMCVSCADVRTEPSRAGTLLRGHSSGDAPQGTPHTGRFYLLFRGKNSLFSV